MLSFPGTGEARMAESLRWTGNDQIVESGSVLLWPDDPSFNIRITDLTFTIVIINDHKRPQLEPERVSHNTMNIRVNRWHQPNPSFKFKVGTLWDNDLYLAIFAQPVEAGRYVLHYTFSNKRP
jgi:hypothetical protein